MIQYVPRYFKAHEIVPKSVHDRFGDASVQFFDPRILRAADMLRDLFGPITINNWRDGGTFDERGLRVYGGDQFAQRPTSMHCFGKALDLVFKNVTPGEVRTWMKTNKTHVSAILEVARVEEETPTWVHIDVANVTPLVWVPVPK